MVWSSTRWSSWWGSVGEMRPRFRLQHTTCWCGDSSSVRKRRWSKRLRSLSLGKDSPAPDPDGRWSLKFEVSEEKDSLKRFISTPLLTDQTSSSGGMPGAETALRIDLVEMLPNMADFEVLLDVLDSPIPPPCPMKMFPRVLRNNRRV